MKRFFSLVMFAFLFTLNACGDSFRDPRDDQSYKVVKIGNQVWLAENLNVEMEGSFCYADKPENCKKYGRLYTWDAAMKACPSGWHLPSKAEFETLFNDVGGKSTAGAKLKSTNGWNEGAGADSYGFTALPAGRKYNGNYYNEGGGADFWSSTVYHSYSAYFAYLGSGRQGVGTANNSYGFSVRCIKD